MSIRAITAHELARTRDESSDQDDDGDQITDPDARLANTDLRAGQRYLPPLDETWKEKQIPASRAPVVDFRQYFSKEERINRVLLQQDRPDIRFITAVAGMTKRSVGSLFEIEDDCSSEVSVWLKSSLNAALLRLEKLTRRTQTPVFRHLYNLALVCNSVREWNEVVLAELSGKGIGRDVRGGPGATTNAVITLAEKMLQNEGVLAAAFSSVDSTDQNSMTFIVPGAAQIGGAANLVAVGTPIYLLEQTLRNVIGALNFYAVQPNKTGPVVGQVQSTLSQMVDVVLRPPYIGDVGLKYGDVYRLFDPKVSSDLVSNLVQLARTKRPALLDEDEYNDRLNSLGKYHHLAEALGAAARQFEKLRPELKRGTARLDDFFAELSQVIDAGDGAIEIAEKAQRSAIRLSPTLVSATDQAFNAIVLCRPDIANRVRDKSDFMRSPAVATTFAELTAAYTKCANAAVTYTNAELMRSIDRELTQLKCRFAKRLAVDRDGQLFFTSV